MHPYDKMVLLTLVSYVFMFIGLCTVASFLLQKLFRLSSQEAIFYSTMGVLFFVGIMFCVLKRKTDNEFRLATHR